MQDTMECEALVRPVRERRVAIPTAAATKRRILTEGGIACLEKEWRMYVNDFAQDRGSWLRSLDCVPKEERERFEMRGLEGRRTFCWEANGRRRLSPPPGSVWTKRKDGNQQEKEQAAQIPAPQ